MSALRFFKVEGAGNDFVLLDGRALGRADAGTGGLPAVTPKQIRRLLDRHRGIGGDGLLLVQQEVGAARPRVRYWNSDGGAAAFCGNGARCVALLLLARAGRAEVEFEFGRRRLRARRAGTVPGDRAGEVRATGARGAPEGAPAAADPQRIALFVPLPRPLAMPSRPPALPGAATGQPLWIDSGVPHWVVPVTGLSSFDVAAFAPAIRSWSPLGSGGTNVDFVEVQRGVLHVRSWERGVEGETLACGSGLVASGWYARSRLGLSFPLRLRSHGRDLFVLRGDPEEAGLWLEGPARIVFQGRITIE